MEDIPVLVLHPHFFDWGPMKGTDSWIMLSGYRERQHKKNYIQDVNMDGTG